MYFVTYTFSPYISTFYVVRVSHRHDRYCDEINICLENLGFNYKIKTFPRCVVPSFITLFIVCIVVVRYCNSLR